MQLTDASQTATDSYLYRAFGEKSVLSGSSPNPFTWVGRLGYYRQPDTSDYWVRARVYGPATGRWVSRDLVWSDLNRFRYALGSPLVFVDCNGLVPEEAVVQQTTIRVVEQSEGAAVGRRAAIRLVGPGAEAAAPSLFGRVALFASRLLGPIGLLLADTGNLVTAAEEAQAAAMSHTWPLVAPQPQPRGRTRCKRCRQNHPLWDDCKPGFPPIKEVAALMRPTDPRAFRGVPGPGGGRTTIPIDPVDRTSYYVCNPHPERTTHPQWSPAHRCAEGRFWPMEVTAVALPPRKHQFEVTFTVICCPCCTASDEEWTYCENLHASSKGKHVP
jgi:RHS repeat-associated protein